jgi:hypothetical protein
VITGPKKLVKRARFFANLFNINPTIDIEYSEEDNFSECVCLEDGTYKLNIQKWLKGEDLLRVMSHEIVHVWQYFRGSLKSNEKNLTYIWENKIYKHTGSMEEYLLRPWEIEARGLEDFCLWKWENR